MNKHNVERLLTMTREIQFWAELSLDPDKFKEYRKAHSNEDLPENYDVHAAATGYMWGVADLMEVLIEGMLKDE